MIEKRFKVPGGKLLVLKAETKKGEVEAVHLEGDFFIHPEESLEIIEQALPNLADDKMEELLQNIVDENEINLVGVDVESMCKLMREAKEDLE